MVLWLILGGGEMDHYTFDLKLIMDPFMAVANIDGEKDDVFAMCPYCSWDKYFHPSLINVTFDKQKPKNICDYFVFIL